MERLNKQGESSLKVSSYRLSSLFRSSSSFQFSCGNAMQKSSSSHKDVVILICNMSSCFAVGAKGGRRWMCIVGARWYMQHALVALKDHNKMKKNIFNSYEYKSVESERCGKKKRGEKGDESAWWKLNLSATHCSFITFSCYSPARLHL